MQDKVIGQLRVQVAHFGHPERSSGPEIMICICREPDCDGVDVASLDIMRREGVTQRQAVEEWARHHIHEKHVLGEFRDRDVTITDVQPRHRKDTLN